MHKVIGIGETVLDIVFRHDQPQAAVPGGSVFNSMVSLSRAGIPVCFISEMGKDRVGELISRFMKDNGLSTDYIDFYEEANSPLALAFLDEDSNASFQFYRQMPEMRMNIEFPVVDANDVCMISSYFAVNPEVRAPVFHLLDMAKENGAMVYYDINFRRPHAGERDSLMPTFIENFQFADIIRASDEDLEVLFNSQPPRFILDEESKVFIITQGEKGIFLRTPLFKKEYPIEVIKPLSAIGAGDGFNAGLVYGMMKLAITKEKLPRLEEPVWDKLMDYARGFAADVCLSYDNYISRTFSKTLMR